MAWQTPKTNWDTVPKNPKSEDLNRIEGNIDFLKTDIETKKGLIVNSMVSNLNRSVTIANTHQELANALVEPTLITGNIKAGSSIFGVSGKPSVVDTADATIVAGDVLSGKTGYKNGAKITGTIPSKAAATITPGTTDQTIAAGQYLSGIQTIAGDANLVAANIVGGKSIFGVAGNFSPVVKMKHLYISGSGVAFGTPNGKDVLSAIGETFNASNSVIFTACGAIASDSSTSAEERTAYLMWAKFNSNTELLLRYQGSRTVNSFITLIEFNSAVINSIQRGDAYNIPSASYMDIVISEINLAKSVIFIGGGFKLQGGNVQGRCTGTRAEFISPTTIRLYTTGYASSISCHWQVVEFK